MLQTKDKIELNNLYDLLFSRNITKREYYRLRKLEEMQLENAKTILKGDKK